MTFCRAVLLCLVVSAVSAADSTTCDPQDGECVTDQTVSLLQTKVEVKPHLADADLGDGKTKKASGKPGKAKFTEETMPPVSTTLKCIINLGTQYFALYSALAVVRTLNSFKYDLLGIQKILETGCTTLTYAPMLCVLFLGCRMRAIQLAQGETEKNSLPQPWVKNGMAAASTAVVLQAILVLLVGALSGLNSVKTDQEGNLDMSAVPDAYPMAVRILTIVRYAVMLMLYAGTFAVIAGVFMMEAPKEIWGDEAPGVSPAVLCTSLLTTLFLAVYLIVAIANSVFELAPAMRQTPGLLKLQTSAESAKMTVNLAPMMCILFIGARMRALQLDPKHGHPQVWAQKCFFMCTASLLSQAGLVFLLPFAAGGECKRGACEGDVAFVVENTQIAAVLTAVRYACLFALYGGVCAVVYSVVTIEAPGGPEKTPPVSPAMKCTMSLTAQYFVVYSVLFVCITVKSFVGEDSAISKAMGKGIAIADAGRATVMFAPMLAILFIGTRMRALQLAIGVDGQVPETAGPQKWAQDCMFLATGSVFVQLLMTVLVTTLMGTDKPELDIDGNVKAPAGSSKFVALFFEVVRYINLINMYFGACAIVLAVFLMTPETVQPYSQRGLFPATMLTLE